MFSKKAFTLTEILTTVAITTVVFGGVSVSISSFSDSSEIFSGEQIFTSKIRSEKVSAISGEINCSKTDLFYGKNFFEIFHGTEKKFSCDKKFFGNISENNGKISFQTYQNPEIQIFKNGGRGGEIYFDKIGEEISFDLGDDFSYKIVAQKGEKIEEIELIFFNDNPGELEKTDVKRVFIGKISAKNFKKEKISGDTLSVIFVNSNPNSKIFLRGEEVNDAEISLKTLNGDNAIFEFFSANIFGGEKKFLDLKKILEE